MSGWVLSVGSHKVKDFNIISACHDLVTRLVKYIIKGSCGAIHKLHNAKRVSLPFNQTSIER